MSLSEADRPGSRRADLVTLVVLVVTGGALGLLPAEAELAVAQQVRSTVLRPFLWTHESLQRHADLARDLERVRASRDSLARLLAAFRDARLENLELREASGLPERTPGSFLAAELEPASSRAGGARTFVLALGDRASPRVPAGVLTARGVLGVVRVVSGGAARGEFWTHPGFRVSVRTEDGAASGIVQASSGDAQPAMLLRGAPFQEDIPEGTGVVTSGLGGLYPPGIPVGVVREVARVESGWQRSYLLEPAVRPDEARMVMVWRRDGETP